MQKCSISNLHANLSFLDVSPITADEFIARRDNLARALHADGVDALVDLHSLFRPCYYFIFFKRRIEN